MTLYVESTDFDQDSLLKGWDEGSFKYCNFSKLEIEGSGFSGVLVGCVIEASEWYWSLFNTATFVDVKFKQCIFRGASFAGCSFTECQFIDCCLPKAIWADTAISLKVDGTHARNPAAQASSMQSPNRRTPGEASA